MLNHYLTVAVALAMAANVNAAANEADKDTYDYWQCAPEEIGKANMKWPEHLRPYGAKVSENPGTFVPTTEFGENSALRQLAKSVGRLEVLIERPDGRRYGTTCTASAVSQDHIVTNNHCIPGKDGGKVIDAFVRFGYYSENDEGDAYKVEVKPADTSSDRDFSLLVVKGDFAAKWGYLDVARLDSRQIKAGEEAVIIHHPAGRPQKITTDCGFNADDATDDTDAFHNCDSLPGSSGSPIFRKNGDKYELVSLHYAASITEATLKYSKRLDRIVETSHYFNRIIPPVAGSYNQVVVMSSNVYKAQTYILSEEFPTAWIKEYWDKGYRITDWTAVARNTSPVTKKWNEFGVVMSKGSGIGAQHYYYEPSSSGTFPTDWVQAKWDEGYRLTTCSWFQEPGNDGSWALVMSKQDSLREQTYFLGPAAEFPKDKVKEFWDKGYKITSVCSGYLPSSNSALMVVMSRTQDYTSQQYLWSQSFPSSFVKEYWDKKYRITTIEQKNEWLVVMSQGPGLEFMTQRYSFRGYFPFGGVATGYSDGLSITGIAGEY
jgi:V8-like Glu-specific endopeptidase